MKSQKSIKQIVPHKQFKEDFALCMKHYEVERDEAMFERDRCLRSEQDYYDAYKCYSVIAAGIRHVNIDTPTKLK